MAEADRLADAGDQSGAWDCRTRAIAHLERAIGLLPDSTGLSTLHEPCLAALEHDAPAAPEHPRKWWRWWH
jgi:hypothetical protein